MWMCVRAMRGGRHDTQSFHTVAYEADDGEEKLNATGSGDTFRGMWDTQIYTHNCGERGGKEMDLSWPPVPALLWDVGLSGCDRHRPVEQTEWFASRTSV